MTAGAHLYILRLLVDDISRGVRKPGQRLPPETQLAQEFGVSRVAIREVIRGLEHRGLVKVRRRYGTVVASPQEWDILDAEVARAVLDGPHAHAILAELVECRRLLEIEAAGIAAERATHADLLTMGRALARMTATSRRPPTPASEDAFHEADITFHNAVLAATANRVLVRLTKPIQDALIAARRPLAHPEVRTERGIPEHSRILTAIARRDAAEARAAMQDHLGTVASYLDESATAKGEGQ